MIIGVTGGIGCGKSFIVNEFRSFGVNIIDADSISRDLTAPGKPALDSIRYALGSYLFADDGSLHRWALADLIFNHPRAKKVLEGILHPLIWAGIDKQLHENPAPYYTVIELPLLFESRSQTKVDRTLVIDVREGTQISRTMKRSKMTADQVRKVMDAQLDRLTRISLADDIIINDFEMDVRDQVRKMHDKYISILGEI